MVEPNLSWIAHPEAEVESYPVIPNVDHIRPAQARVLRKIIAEKYKRSMEALSLYDPLALQLKFHMSDAKIRMNRGSNRAGKSQCSGAEIAWMATGTHPYLDYPKEGGTAYCIGWDHRHVGQVMWRYVGRPGAFSIIRDEHTKRWRSFRPWNEYDQAYKEKTKESPPFLPERFIKGGYNGISWESRKDDIPKMVPMVNGWKLYFASSRGAPQQGITLDAAWIDEEIENPAWYKETVARLSKRRIRVIWSATPLAATEQLYALHQKCYSPQNDGSIAEFILTIDDNPYIPQKEKDEFKALLTPEELQVRYYGKFALAGFKRYPEYSLEEHGYKGRQPGPSATRYMVVDPGTQVCAVLFAAVPKPDVGGKVNPHQVVVYDELYIKRCSAKEFGRQVKQKMGQYSHSFEAFIIDHQYGRIQEAGIGKTVEEQYSEALEYNGIKSRRTGHGFIRGSSDLAGRQEALRRLLQVRASTGDSPLKIGQHCKYLDWEMNNQFFRKESDGRVSDKRKPGIPDHAVDCLEYLAAYDPQWVPATPVKAQTNSWILDYLEKKQKAKSADAIDYVTLGPPGV